MTNRSQTQTAMPVTEKIGLAFALLTAMLLLGFALFSLIVDTIVKFNVYGILVDLIFLGIGIFLGYFSVRIYKKSIYYEGLVSSAFDEGIYARLEPVLRKIAETCVEMEDVENRLNKIDHMVQTVMEEQVHAGKSPRMEVEKAIAPGTSIGFAVKAIFLTIISMSGALLLIATNFPTFVNYLVVLAFYVLWWVLVSSEFKLFDDMAAWMLVFIPILLVPLGFMLLNAYFQINNVIALFYGLLALYAFLYYSWATYETKGTLPFRLWKLT